MKVGVRAVVIVGIMRIGGVVRVLRGTSLVDSIACRILLGEVALVGNSSGVVWHFWFWFVLDLRAEVSSIQWEVVEGGVATVEG